MFIFYKKHFIGIETMVSLLLAMTITYASDKYGFLEVPDVEFLYMLIGAFAGLLGFIIAISAILFALEDGKKLEHFKRSTQYEKVMEIYLNSIKWIGLSTLALIVVLMSALQIKSQYTLLITAFSIAVTSIKIWRCVWITNKLFQLSLKKSTD